MTFATKEYSKNIASIFGTDSVLVLSVDDKKKVQQPKEGLMVMHMTNEIRLPDHDFAVATSHNLTASVYASCEVTKCSYKSDLNISYSRPMYIVT